MNSLGRMLAALASALLFGTTVAVLADGQTALAVVVVVVLAFVPALAIAAALVAPVLIVRAVRGRRLRPPGGVLAAALVAGGLIVFPVYSNFYDDAEFAAMGGGVGYCGGALPLAQVVHNRIADEPYARLYYWASCDD